MLAEDHPIYRSGIVRAISLRPDLELVGAVGNGRAALDAIIESRPDVALLDIRMPGLDGIEVVKALRARGVATPVLLVTGSEDADGLYAVLAAGASGYLLKTSENKEICDALVAVSRGEILFSSKLHASLVQDIRAREQGNDRPFLSDREQEILRLTAAGRSASDIAGDLHLSVATIRSHLRSAYQKLDVSERAAAVAKAMRLRLID